MSPEIIQWLRERWRVLAVIGAVMVLLLLALVLPPVLVSDRGQERTRLVEIEACQRLQKLRNRVNVNGAVIWLSLQSDAKREFLLARQTQWAERSIHLSNAYAKRRLAARLRYQPATDCQKAVDYPGVYVRPPARPYNKALANSLTT